MLLVDNVQPSATTTDACELQAARTLDHEDNVHVRNAPLVPQERRDSNISGTWAYWRFEAYYS